MCIEQEIIISTDSKGEGGGHTPHNSKGRLKIGRSTIGPSPEIANDNHTSLQIQQNILHKYFLQQTSLTTITSFQIRRTANAIPQIRLLTIRPM